MLRLVAVPLIAVAGLTLAAPAQQPDTLLHPLFNPGTSIETGTRQGYSVAVDGNIAVVGASLADVGALNSGVARVYDVQTGALLHTLNNPSPANNDQFGVSVAISGNLVVVGAHLDNTGATDAGTVYIYDLTAEQPTVPVAELNDPGLPGADRFGATVAISGSVLAVGAPLEDFNDVGSGDVIMNTGRVYVYDLNSAAPLDPVLVLDNPSPEADDQFGSALAIAASRVVVGASRDDTGQRNAGSAYVYDLTSATPENPVAVLNNPAPALNDLFGFAVAITGTRVVVGAYADDAGATNAGSAYVYDLSSATPTVPVRTLDNPAPSTNDQFGFAIAASGSRVVIGANLEDFGAGNAGRAYVFDLDGMSPGTPVVLLDNPNPALGDQFGVAVAISGTRVVVGASLDDTRATNAGSAYTFDLAGATPGALVAVLDEPSPASGDLFGGAVAISGNLVVVGATRSDAGANNTGRAYVYDFASATPTLPLHVLDNPNPNAGDQFGNAVAISGRRVVVAASLHDAQAVNSGSVYIYDLDRVTPTAPVLMLNNPTPAAGDQFGSAVALSGNILVVGARFDDFGAPNAGRAYAFDLTGASPVVPVAVFDNPTPAQGDQFGSAVAVSGTRVVVGAFADDTGASSAGSAYVFDLSGPAPAVPQVVLNNPRASRIDQFGISVAISGTRIVVGAHLEDIGATNAGSAYVFDVAGPAPAQPLAILDNPRPATSDQFGGAVAISGDRVVVGASLNDAGAMNAGSAYVYDLSAGRPFRPVAILTNPNPSPGDQFAAAVGIDGVNVVIGARLDDTGAVDRGAAFIFGPGNPPTVVLATGTAATGGTLPPGSVFRSFAAPDVAVSLGKVAAPDKTKLDAIFAGTGAVLLHSRQLRTVEPGTGTLGQIARLRVPSGDAVIATLVRDGAAVTAANDVVLFTGLLNGTPQPAARKGQEIPGNPGVRLKSFLNVDGNGSTTFFTAKLAGTGVTEANNTAVFGVGAGGLRLLVRQGMTVGARPIQVVTTLIGEPGTLSEGRWRSGPDELGVRVTFAGRAQALYLVPASAVEPDDWVLVAGSGQDTTPDLPGARLQQFGLPGYGPGSALFASQLEVGAGGITPRNRSAVFDTEGFDFGSSSGLRLLMQQEQSVPGPAGGAATGSRLVRVRSVLAGLERASTVIADATASLRSPVQMTIFDAGDEGTLRPIAKAGDPAPGGGTWDRFVSVAKPDGSGRGALILATLRISPSEGILAKSRTALFAVDSSGYLRRLLRTGDAFESAGPGSPIKTVKTFSALTAAAGSAGAARGYDADGNVVALVTFTDRTQAIVKLRVP